MTYFNDHEVDILLQMVAANPPVYDIRLKEYKDCVLKERLWQKIAKKVNKTPEDCKKRWKSTRDSYRRIKRNNSKKSKKKNKIKWALYDKLSFLENGNTNTSDAEVTENEDSNDEIYFADKTNDNEDSDSNEPLNKRMNITNLQAFKSIDVDISPDQSTLQPEDEIKSFSSYVGTMLAKLAPDTRIEAKTKVFNLLAEYEMNDLKRRYTDANVNSILVTKTEIHESDVYFDEN